MANEQQPGLYPGARKHRRSNTVWAALLLTVGLAFVLAAATTASARPVGQTAEEGKAIFQSKCAGCHTIGGGKLVGPDLQGVTQQRDRQWLEKFISDPAAMFAANDPVATELLKANNNIKMPTLGLTKNEVAAVIAYFESVDSGEAVAAPAGASAVAAGAGSPAAGEQLFTGQRQMSNGGTSCQACHTVNGVSALGGGTLGPDLTQVYTRYGENGLNAALTNIAFPSMVGIFANKPIDPQERADLMAFFKEANQRNPAPITNTWIIFGSGLVLMLILFALLLISWPRQRQSLSDRLRRGRG